MSPAPVEVELKPPSKASGLLWLVFLPMGMLIAASANDRSGPLYGNPLPLGFGLVAACIPLMLTFARRFAVKQADARGLLLRSGQLFLWSDLRGIQRFTVKKKGLPPREDYAIGFRTGGVRIRSDAYVDVTALWKFLAQVEKHQSKAQ